MKEGVKQLIEKVLKSELSESEILKNSCNWSSLNLMLIIMEIEHALEIEIPDSLLPKIKDFTVSELCKELRDLTE